MCVSGPRLLITSGVIWILYDWVNKFYSFYMVAVVGIISMSGLGIEVHCRKYPNKTKPVLYKPLILV